MLWRALGAGQLRGGCCRSGLLPTELLELCDDHFAAVDVTVQQRQQLAQHCGKENRFALVTFYAL